MKTKVFLLKGFNTCFTQVGQVRLQIRILFFDSCRPTGRHIWVADLAKKEMFFFKKKPHCCYQDHFTSVFICYYVL